MSLFQFSPNDIITSYSIEQQPLLEDGLFRVTDKSSDRKLNLVADGQAPISLADQFIIFQLNNELEGPTILESSRVEPKIEGSAQAPDVLVSLEMLSFHLGAGEDVEPDTRVTMRINFGKDESSTDKRFDTAFWSIAAGLKLYDQYKNSRTESKDLKADIRKAFGNRPIEIYGGLGKLSFEVVKHKEPEWWQRIFGFARGDVGKSLVSVLGFPAITTQAIDMLDELLNRLIDTEPKALFKSLPMRLALSKYARDEFTGGNPRVKIGTLNQGFCVMTRGKDFDTVSKANAIYYPTYGKLVPLDLDTTALMTGKYEDPLADVTYVVFRVGMKNTKLDPEFNYSV